MTNTGVIDQFLEVFTRYIDSGFGLVQGEVAFVATTLIVIDMTLAALFWTFDGAGENDMMARLIKKTIFVGAFAYLIGNWNSLAAIVFNSFAGLGLKASGTGFSVADMMRPGKLAQTGLDAGAPLLDAASDVMGASTLFPDLIQIGCLGLAWLFVVMAFFILAIQMFVVLVEFKLTTLAGFVLIPFGLFGKSAFMAEKVLGNVVSSGIKVLVLAVITGIGSTLFDTFIQDFGDTAPTIEDAMAVVLASLTLLGLGIFGPAVANGLVSGGPQLGAGSAIGTGLAAGGALAAGAAGIGMAARGAMALGAGAAGLARSGAAAVGATQAAYGMGAMGRQGASAVAGGLAGVARAAASPMAKTLQATAQAFRDSYQQGVRSGFQASGGTVGSGSAPSTPPPTPTAGNTPPQWARDIRHNQAFHSASSATAHAVRSGDAAGGGHAVDLNQGD